MSTIPRLPRHHRTGCLRWTLLAIVAVLALALVLGLADTTRAQSFDRLDAHHPPELLQNAPQGGGFTDWLEKNKTILLIAFGILAAILVITWMLRQNARGKRLQRDALERLRKSLLESCKATRGPAKSVWITGSPRDPPARLGRYAGHHRSVDAVWISYRTWLFGPRKLLCTNNVDLNGLDAPEIHVRAISINITRSLGYAVPDIHNPTQRAEWQASTNQSMPNAQAFAEAWKAYYAHAIDNAIAFYDAMNAAEDRSFLRQEVTRSQEELTDTLATPAPQSAPTPEAADDA